VIRSEARERLEVECEVDIPDESIVEDLELVVEGFNRDKSSEETGRAEIDLDLELWLLNVGMLGNLTSTVRYASRSICPNAKLSVLLTVPPEITERLTIDRLVVPRISLLAGEDGSNTSIRYRSEVHRGTGLSASW